MQRRVHIFLACLATIGWLLPSSVPAGERSDRDQVLRVNAAYLFNFTRFTTWPELVFANDDDPIVIGVLGQDPFGEILDKTIASRWAQDRRVIARRICCPSDLTEGSAERQKLIERLYTCHVLFVGDLGSNNWSDIRALLRGMDVLTISDMPGFAEAGGMIGLELVEGKTMFCINLSIVEKTRLRISSRVLQLAKVIRKDIDGL